MRIGIVCYPTFGGSGVVATELGKALADKGHRIHFITYSQPVRLDYFSENISYHEVTIAKYPLFDYIPYETALTSKLVDVALFEGLDVLHVHYAIPHASVAYLAKQILAAQGVTLPVVTTLHGTDITLVGKDSSYLPVVTFAINHSDGVTAVSDSLKQDTYNNFKISKDIEVIPNFIDLKRFSKKAKDHFRKAIAPNGERLIVHTSNFRKVKRVQDVVHVFNKLKDQVPSKLLLIGDGPERHNTEQLCRDLNLCEDIRFLGKQESFVPMLQLSHLFLLPSESESFGLAALEAMSCGVPVIASNAHGLPEVVTQGQTGFLSDVGDVQEMAQNSIKLLKDEALHQKFSLACREKALEKYKLSTLIDQYEEYYYKILTQS